MSGPCAWGDFCASQFRLSDSCKVNRATDYILKSSAGPEPHYFHYIFRMKIKGDGQEKKLTPHEHAVWHGDTLCVHVIERMHMSCRILEKKIYGSRRLTIKSVNTENKMKSRGTEFHFSLEIISHDIYGTSPRKALVNAWHFVILIL